MDFLLPMYISRLLLAILFIYLLAPDSVAIAAPKTFSQAKQLMPSVYGDVPETFYCGCAITWTGGPSGRPDHPSCGYEVRKQTQLVRAERIEWEHVVAAHTFGQQRPCWRTGGRDNCTANDSLFKAMEADMHNLVPAVGEVNGDRSNFRFGVLPSTPYRHGQCPVKIDFQQRAIEPRPEIRGDIARINFYMYDHYGLKLSRQQQQLFLAWHHEDPVSKWELTRNDRIARAMGRSNPYVTGLKQWHLNKGGTAAAPRVASMVDTEPVSENIRGNRNSRVYHLPVGCPSYNAIKTNNIVKFGSEQQATDAGYRKARNCEQREVNICDILAP